MESLFITYSSRYSGFIIIIYFSMETDSKPVEQTWGQETGRSFCFVVWVPQFRIPNSLKATKLCVM